METAIDNMHEAENIDKEKQRNQQMDNMEKQRASTIVTEIYFAGKFPSLIRTGLFYNSISSA